MKNLQGKVLFLDRSDINTDEIIPAKYLTESTKIALKPYCLEDLIVFETIEFVSLIRSFTLFEIFSACDKKFSL